jgi:amino acid transporter
MISPTKNIQKIIFYPTSIMSAGLNAFLFFRFGSNILTSSVSAFIGIIFVVYQVFALRQWQNSKKTTKNYKRIKTLKRRWQFVTAFSLIATIFFGIQEIEKKISIDADKTAKIEIISAQIKEFEKSLLFDDSEIIKKQIADLQKETQQNTEYGKYRNNKKINELRNQLKIGKTKTLDKISDLKIKRAELMQLSESKQSGFTVMANVLLPFLNKTLSERIVRIVFLIGMAFGLELIMYSTGTEITSTTKKNKGKNISSKLKKEIKNGQTFFDGKLEKIG